MKKGTSFQAGIEERGDEGSHPRRRAVVPLDNTPTRGYSNRHESALRPHAFQRPDWDDAAVELEFAAHGWALESSPDRLADSYRYRFIRN